MCRTISWWVSEPCLPIKRLFPEMTLDVGAQGSAVLGGEAVEGVTLVRRASCMEGALAVIETRKPA